MARAMVISERQGDTSWKPTVVVLATRVRLDARALSGDTRRDAWVANMLDIAKRAPGQSWEDWIDAGVYAYANGHDLWADEVEPETTIAALFQREILGAEPAPITPPGVQPSDTLPELGDFEKVIPS